MLRQIAVFVQLSIRQQSRRWVPQAHSTIGVEKYNSVLSNFMMDEGEDRVRATYGKNYNRLAKISQGMSNRAIAHRLGVSEKAIRKLVGPSKPADSAQLAFVGITTAAAGLGMADSSRPIWLRCYTRNVL